MGAIAEKSGLMAHTLSFDAATSDKRIPAPNNGFVGLVFPTHGFTAPWHVMKFVWNLPHGKARDVYCVATRAGLKFGPVFLPGISGSATFVISLLLFLKGYTVRGSMSVDMPSNWYSLHPIQSRKSHEAIIGRAEAKVAGFMDKVLSQSRVWFTSNNLYELILGGLLSIVSVAYLLFGKFFLAKLFFANNRCDGCRLCEAHCSVRAIRMRGKETRRPYWRYNCESCMKCAAICPQNAIEAGHSWGVILYFITAVPLSAYLFSLLGIDLKSGGLSGTYVLQNAINIAYFYPALFLSYYVFSLIIRIPLVNALFTHTTFTHLPFWGRYREPKTKLSDIR